MRGQINVKGKDLSSGKMNIHTFVSYMCVLYTCDMWVLWFGQTLLANACFVLALSHSLLMSGQFMLVHFYVWLVLFSCALFALLHFPCCRS